MRSELSFACALALCCLFLFGGGVDAQSPATWTPELTFTVKRLLTVIPSPDGSKVAFVVSEALMDGDKSEWLSQIHVANADGSDSRQFTRADKSATHPRWSPDGRWIAFITARDGHANVWRVGLGGGEAEQLTREKGEISAFEWSPDGNAIAFIMADPKSDDEEKAAKEKRDWRTIDQNLKLKRLYVQRVIGAERSARTLTTANYSVEEFDWSPDSRRIVLQHQPTASPNDWPHSDLSLVAVDDGTTSSLVSSGAAEQSPRFSPDGQSVAFESSDPVPGWAGTKVVHVIPVGRGPIRALATTFDAQAEILHWSANGRSVVVSETRRTVPTLYLVPTDGTAPVPVSPTNLNVTTPALNERATHIGFVSQDFDRAPEAFVAPLEPFRAAQVSHVQPTINAPIGRSEVLTWKNPDGREVEGILTYPPSYAQGAHVPLLVIVHGGPAQVFMNTFLGSSGFFAVAPYASQGYAILRVNPRGSSGYGREFRYANLADWGGGDYRDIMSGVDHVIGMGVVDPDRLGVMGWSYGGFMTSWIVTQTQRFKAAAAGAPVTDLISFNGTTDIPGFVPDYFNGDFWKVFDTWRAHSPVMNVSGVKTPTLLLHGDADVRVPISQSYEFYQALKRQGVTTQMIVFPRQPHNNFPEPKMTLEVTKASLDWFNRFVLGLTSQTRATQ